MKLEDFTPVLDSILDELKIEDALEVEKALFREAITLQLVQLNRVPTSYQIKQSWLRWKTERGLDKVSEDGIKEVDLYHKGMR